MARIERETQKVFGGNAPLNQITTFGSIKEGNPVYSSDVGDLQTEAFETGWTAAVEDDYAPYRQDRNAVDKVTTSQLAYQFQEGVAEWDVGTTYYKGSIVKINTSTGFNLYNSLTDDNVGNNPTSSTANWQLWTDNSFPYSRITNCITYIPQDIKLELNDGTLTLKAGSKVYVPNGKNADGSNKFDVVVVESDRAIQNTSSTVGQRFVWVTLPSGYGNGVVQYYFSGTTSTMSSTKADTFSTFYNTETNKIYRGNGTAWEEKPYSLPICLATNDTTAKFTSIDQVFNGFGYIGSIVFVLPGVKGLAPNGRNADGTLKNEERIWTNVQTISTTSMGEWLLHIKSNVGARFAGVTGHYIQDEKPIISSTYGTWYSPSENIFRLTNDGGASWVSSIGFIHCINLTTTTGGVVASFNPKLPFRAADCNDLPQIVYWE